MNPEFSVNNEVKNSVKVANMIEQREFDREQAMNNYRKLFTRGSSLTKEILERVQHAEVARNKRRIFGYEIQTRHIWMLLSLLILFLFSFCGCITFWLTNWFDLHVKSHLVLQNGSESFDSWRNPNARPYMRVHIFNYTNIEDFQNGQAEKLIIDDIGPYTFQEHVEKVKIVFNNDQTLTYQEQKSFKFISEKSQGRQSDRLVVPNMPMLSAVSQVKNAYFFQQVALGSFLKTLNAETFLNLPAQRFIWGYDDAFFTVVKSLMAFQKPLPIDKFGIIAHKNGTNKNRITIKTGADDINQIGVVVKYNDEKMMHHWSTDECNRMDGTDGAFFGPDVIRNKLPVNIYHRDLCRKFPFAFQKEYSFLNIAPTYRYVPPTNIFANPDIEPKNQCFCDLDTGSCPPHGVFNATPCALGPAYISFPHFLHGDPTLLEHFEGLNPDSEKHSSYLDIHPTLGYTMAGCTKLQINVLIKKPFGVNQVDMFKEDTLLPVAWFDVGLTPEELPQSIIDVVYRTSYTIPRIEMCLKYGSLLLLLITSAGLILLVRGRMSTKITGRRLERHISGLDVLIH